MRPVIAALSLALLASSSAASPLPDPDTEVAMREFEAGAELYRQRRYEGAIARFEAAWKLKPLPLFDYNIARCYDRLGRWGDAADAYERYLAVAAPGGSEAALVADRVAVLRARARDDARAKLPAPVAVAAVATPVSSAPDLAGPRKRAGGWRWWVAGSAGVAVVGGAVVGLGVGLREGEVQYPTTTEGLYVVRFP